MLMSYLPISIKQYVYHDRNPGEMQYRIFRLMDCEEITKNYIFLVHFHTLFHNIYLFIGEMKSNIVMSIYSYLFPMCLLRKTFFFHIFRCYISIH